MTSRASTLAALQHLLDDPSEPQVVGIVGAAGIGKSYLLGTLAAALPGRRVVLTGIEEEAAVVWSGLEQLVRALRPSFDRVPEAHAGLLRQLLDGSHRVVDRPVEPISVATAAHALICAAAVDEPLVIVVDDAHWLDDDSRAALRFVARRLLGESVTVVNASRTADALVAARHVDLGDLDHDEALGLLRARGLALTVATAVARDAGGVPLLLTHIADRLTAEQRSGAEPLPVPLPVSSTGLPFALAERLRALPARTRHALHLMAVGDPLGSRWTEVLAGCGFVAGDLVPAEASGLVSLGPRAASFTHPLHRAAALADATPAERRDIHRLLARSIDDPDRALVHHAEALLGPDDPSAAALDDLAERHARRGAPASAAALWRRAATVWSDPVAARRSAVRSARAALAAGNIEPARHVLGGAIDDLREPAPDVPLDEVDLASAYHLAHGDPEVGHRLLAQCGRALLDAGSPDAVRHLLEAARHRVRQSDIPSAMEIHALLESLPPDRVDAVTRAKIDALAATGDRTADRVDRMRDAVDRILRCDTPAAADLAFLADVVALPFAFSRQYDDALRLVDRLRAEAVRTNQPAVSPLLDTAIACARSRYDLPGCVAAASSAIEWADDLNQPNLAVTALVYLVVGHSLLGNEAVFPAADRLRPHGQFGRLTADMSIGCYWLTVGRPDSCLEALLPLHHWLDGELKVLQFWQADLGEAAVRMGDRDLAREVADQLGRFHEQLPNQWLEGARTRIEGLLADVDDCDRWFEHSVEQFHLGRATMAEARSRLLWGERLRRARRRADARPHLESARALFAQVGASRWTARCDQELLAAGATARPDDADRSAEQLLTAQELYIARLAVAGGSYKSIAAELFLSPRTVETHLSTVYRKLGLRNRAGLAAAAQRDATLQMGDPTIA